jgi:hypothetical protein
MPVDTIRLEVKGIASRQTFLESPDWSFNGKANYKGLSGWSATHGQTGVYLSGPWEAGLPAGALAVQRFEVSLPRVLYDDNKVLLPSEAEFSRAVDVAVSLRQRK